MDFLDPAITGYAERHTSHEPPVLRELNRETHAKVLMPRMLSGHLQGRLLSMISHMIRPFRILEIGTYTGYSAICFAEGLAPGGEVHTIDINDELRTITEKYISLAGMKDQITTFYGNALDIIPELTDLYDLIFIDADKENYTRYYELVFAKTKPGGIILADNVLWSGKVLGQTKMDKDTRALAEFNDTIRGDDRIEKVMLPVRDGLLVIRKK
jgi:caffeoyl-CoA O-methyltransferase